MYQYPNHHLHYHHFITTIIIILIKLIMIAPIIIITQNNFTIVFILTISLYKIKFQDIGYFLRFFFTNIFALFLPLMDYLPHFEEMAKKRPFFTSLQNIFLVSPEISYFLLISFLIHFHVLSSFHLISSTPYAFFMRRS